MPRKKKDKTDNTIQFPTTADPAGRNQQEVDDANKLSVKVIDEKRTEGLRALDKKCDNYDHRPLITKDRPVSENDLRDIEGGIKAVAGTVEALNGLTDMIRHDLVNTIGNLEHQSIAQFQASAHLQTLIALLIQKGLITDNEMRDTWDKVIKSQVAEAKGEDPSK